MDKIRNNHTLEYRICHNKNLAYDVQILIRDSSLRLCQVGKGVFFPVKMI